MSHPSIDPQNPDREDPLLRRYQEANALDEKRPGAALREAVLAQARRQATARQPSQAIEPGAAANDSHWKLRALGSLAVVGLLGLLVMQFERGTPQEQDMALGAPGPRADAPSPDASSGIATGPAAAAKASDAPAAPPAVAQAAPPPPGPVPLRPAPARKATPPVAPAAPEATAAIAPMQAAERMVAPEAPETMARAAPAPAMDAAPAMAQAESPATMSRAPSAAPAPGTPGGSRTAKRREIVAESQSGTARDAASPQLPPLHAAAAKGDLDRLQNLLAQGQDINARDRLGRTALMLAAMGKQKNLVVALMHAGADAGLRDPAGLSAADHATRAGHSDWLPLLQPQR
jgi:hypothetical protein